MRIEPYKGTAPDEVGDCDDVVPNWLGCRPFDPPVEDES
jgi:hypothetical protein